MFGWMRDDGADFIGSYPIQSSTVTTQLLGAGYVYLLSLMLGLVVDLYYSLSANVTAAVEQSPLFPLPSGSDALANLFNLTSRVGTDGQFR